MSQRDYIHTAAKYGCQCRYTIMLAYSSVVNDKNSITDVTSLKFQEKHFESLLVRDREREKRLLTFPKPCVSSDRGEAHRKPPSDLTNKSRQRERENFPQTRDMRHQVEPLNNPALSTGIGFNQWHLFVRAAE